MLFVFLMVLGIVVIPTLLFVEIMLHVEEKGNLIWRINYIFHRNDIYECVRCERIYRQYQAAKGKRYKKSSFSSCPHCVFDSYRPRKIKETKWMNVHPDCPKTNLHEHFKLMRMFKEIEKNKQDIKDQEYFEEYNKLHVDLKWIENLSKKQGE